jgi:spermidine synthase
MIPWLLLDRTPVPGGDGELALYRRGEEYSIRITGRGELMNSRVHGSEDALAALACARLAGRRRPRLLIGGLGMGFTLAAALRALGPDAEVTVAELVPAVVAWNRGALGAAAGNPLRDPRVTVHELDVARIVRSARVNFDAILLDIDNGPEGLTRAANDWLYGSAGLDAAYAALRPEGILAVWSAGPDREFTDRLRRAGFEAEELRVRAHNKKGARHVIWLARRSGNRDQATN